MILPDPCCIPYRSTCKQIDKTYWCFSVILCFSVFRCAFRYFGAFWWFYGPVKTAFLTLKILSQSMSFAALNLVKLGCFNSVNNIHGYSDKMDHGQNGPRSRTKRTTSQDKTDHVPRQNGPGFRTKWTTFLDKMGPVLGQTVPCKKIHDVLQRSEESSQYS